MMITKKKKRKFGFTLAEVLIVLVILGVIAAICVQSIKVYNTQQQGFDTKAEKALSIIGQAVIMIILKDSSYDDLTGLYDDDGKFSIEEADNAARIVSKFKKHLSVNEISLDTTDEYFTGSLLDYKRTVISNTLTDVYSNFFYIQDGTLLGFRFYGNCTSTESYAIPPNSRETMEIADICASVFVDVNGEKKPNKLGSDQIIIPLDERGIKYSES